MRHRFWPAGGAIPIALMIGACSDEPTAPADTKVNFHVIAPSCDFITGGGFVIINDVKFTFGLHGGQSEGGTVFGHLTVVDHGTGTTYQSTDVITYGEPIAPFSVSIPGTGVTRLFEGHLRIDQGAEVSFAAYMNDSGEPGVSDAIAFRVGATWVIAGPLDGGLPTMWTLGGGNFQYHDHCIPGDPQSGK